MNGLTTVESRNNPFHLEIYFPLDPKCSTCNLEALGDIYLDDGDVHLLFRGDFEFCFLQ